MQIRRPMTGGLSLETSGASSSAGWNSRSALFGPRALKGPPSKARVRRKRNVYPCAGSPECLLNRKVWTQMFDGPVEPSARSSHRAAGDRSDVVERHVQVEVEDDHQTVLVTKP